MRKGIKLIVVLKPCRKNIVPDKHPSGGERGGPLLPDSLVFYISTVPFQSKGHEGPLVCSVLRGCSRPHWEADAISAVQLF